MLFELFNQRLVGPGVFQGRIFFQRLFVSVDGTVQITGFGQGVAPVVVGAGTVALGEGFRRRRVILRPIQRAAAPFRVLEVLGGRGRITVFQSLGAPLIRSQEWGLPVRRLSRLGEQAAQGQGDYQHQQTAPETVQHDG